MVRMLMILSFLGLLSFHGGCEKRDEDVGSGNVTSKEVQQKVSEAMETAADYAKQEKDDYVAQVQKDMDAARRDIERLKAKAKTASAKAKAEIDRDVKSAEAKWAVAEQKLLELKAASVESWKNLRAGMDKAVDDVKELFSRNKG